MQTALYNDERAVISRRDEGVAMLQETIRQLYPELTRSQRKLADFIAESYREVAFMTAARLAERLTLNEATVIRFAQRLGYAGYPDLIADVRQMVHQELEAPQATVTGGAAPLHDQLNAQLAEAQRVVSHIASELAEDALDQMLAASRIHVLGQGLASAMAQTMSLALRACGLEAECPSTDPLCLAVLSQEVSPEALVIGISLDESPQIASLLAAVGQRGTNTLALTYSSVSPCAQAAEMAIICGQSDATVLPSLTPIAVTIDALVQTAAQRLGSSASTRLAAIRSAQVALA